MKVTTAFSVACLILLVTASAALSQVGAQGSMSGHVLHATSADYELDFWMVYAGGSASGGPYTVECAAGQAEVGAMSSDQYTVSGGVWGGEVVTPSHWVYLPIILRTALIGEAN